MKGRICQQRNIMPPEMEKPIPHNQERMPPPNEDNTHHREKKKKNGLIRAVKYRNERENQKAGKAKQS